MTGTPKKRGKRGRRRKASIYQRDGSQYWWIRRAVPGVGEIRLSTRTTDMVRAARLDDLVYNLRNEGRFDVLRALKAGEITLPDLTTHRGQNELNLLLESVRSPLLAPLLEKWLLYGADDIGLRDSSMRRYVCSWRRIRQQIPAGARLDFLNQSLVVDFKRARVAEAKAYGKKISAATINRDLAAIGCFLTWCAGQMQLNVKRPVLKYGTESPGRTRWLSTEDIAALESIARLTGGHYLDFYWRLEARSVRLSGSG